MGKIDIAILIILGIFAIIGFAKGFIRQVLCFANLLVALFLAFVAVKPVSVFLSGTKLAPLINEKVVEFLASKGEIVLFSDAVFSTPIEELDKLIKEIEDYDVVIGSRSIDENLLLKKQPIHRILIGKIAKLLIRLVLNINYKDTQCGFKLFKRDVAFKLFYKMRMKRWSFDYELLFLAKRFKFKVREVPVIWINNEDSRVNSFIDPIKSFIDLIKIRFNKY